MKTSVNPKRNKRDVDIFTHVTDSIVLPIISYIAF